MKSLISKQDVDEETEEGDVITLSRPTLYVSSTDYVDATNAVSLRKARFIGTAWMKKCGIPPVLIGVVNATVFQPRYVYFTGLGPLKEIGEPCEENIRRVLLVRGIMMGDPLTKVVLHIINMSARQLSILTKERLQSAFSNPTEVESVLRSWGH